MGARNPLARRVSRTLALVGAPILFSAAEGAKPALAFQSVDSAPLLAGSVAAHRSGPLHFDYEVLAFDAPHRTTETVFTVSVDGARLSPRVSSAGWGYAVAARLELMSEGQPAASVTDTVSLACTGRLAGAHGVPVYLASRVPPGLYDFRLELTDAYRQRGNPTSVAEGRLLAPSFDGPGPIITPLAVATDSVAEPWAGRAGGLQVNPTHLVTSDSPPFVYFEVYGVRPGGTVRTDLTLEPLGRAGAVDRLLRGAPRPFTIRFRDRAPNDPSLPIRTTLRIELEGLRPGPYAVTAVVTEAGSGAASLPMTSSLELIDSRRSGYSSVVCELAGL